MDRLDPAVRTPDGFPPDVVRTRSPTCASAGERERPSTGRDPRATCASGGERERPSTGRERRPNRRSRPGAIRRARAAIGLLAAGALWAGCAPAPAGESIGNGPGDGNSGTEAVMLAVEHETRWRVLRIEGETNLPDGAVVTYQVTHALANELPRGEWPAQNLISDGAAVVHEGVYWTRLNTTYWPPGRVEVLVRFPVAPQPDPVRLRYGQFGEHLTGDNVSDLGGSKVVTAEHAFDWAR